MVGLILLLLYWLFTEAVLPHPQAADGTQLAFWNLAAPLVLGIGKALLGNRGKKSLPGDREFQAQSAADRTRGAAAEGDYYDYASNFDATDATRTTAGALSQDWIKQFGRSVEDLRGNQVSRGRLDSGFGMEDEDRYVTDFQDNVAKQLAALSLNTTGMNLAAKERLGAYGERTTGRSLDLTATRRDQELTDRASKRAMYGQLGGALIGAAGSYYGNRGG